MGTIYSPSDSGSKDTGATSLIQCINGGEPYMHKLWCLGLDGISRKVCPKPRVDFTNRIV